MKINSVLLFIFLIFSCKKPKVEEHFYSNGSIEVRFTQIGEKLSQFEGFYENGSLKSKGKILGGLIDGLAVDYFENGNIKSISPYNMGKLDGLMKIYDPNGDLNTYKYFMNDEIFYTQNFKNKKVFEEHVIPIITRQSDSNGDCSIDISIPFNDTLAFYDYFVQIVYKFSQDSTSWGYEPDEGEFILDKSNNTFKIDCDKNINNYDFIKTLSTIRGRDTLAYLNVKRIRER